MGKGRRKWRMIGEGAEKGRLKEETSHGTGRKGCGRAVGCKHATDFLFTKLPSMAARRHRYMSAQRAYATIYDFVRIRKGSPSGQMWHMVWQVETVLGISPDWARCPWEGTTCTVTCIDLRMASMDSGLPTVC